MLADVWVLITMYTIKRKRKQKTEKLHMVTNVSLPSIDLYIKIQ